LLLRVSVRALTPATVRLRVL